MSTQEKIAIVRFRDAREVFEQSLEAIKQCDLILHQMKTIKYMAEKEGVKANIRLAEEEIKKYEAHHVKLNDYALFCAHEVMRHAAICAVFGFTLDCATVDKAQELISK